MRKKYLLVLSILFLASSVATSQPKYLFDNMNVVVENLGINTPSSDFGLAIIDSEFMFNSLTKQALVKGKKETSSFYELFTCEIDELGNVKSMPVKLTAIRSDYHEGPMSYCQKSGQLFLTRSSEFVSSEKSGIYKAENFRLGIVLYQKTDSGWEFVENLPMNSKEYSVVHPAVNLTGDTLVFASDMPGGMGKTDLYYSAKVDGKWTKPVNLGSKINTSGNEMFPFLNTDGTLIFASERSGGFGGLDLYYTRFSPDSGSEVVLMGDQFNSQADDFGMVIDDNQRFGYFVSNRKGGSGSDDIYSFRLDEAPLNLLIVSKQANQPVPDTEIEISDQQGNVIASGKSNADGRFAAKLKLNAEYRINAGKPGYKGTTQSFSLSQNDLADVIEKKLILEPQYQLEGEVVDMDYNPIPGALVRIVLDHKAVGTITTDEQGRFYTSVSPDQDYVLNVSANQYIAADFEFSTIGIEPGVSTYSVALYSMKAGTRIELKNIYYDLGKHNIRPDAAKELDKLVEMMNENPGMRIRLESHTDSRGSDRFNLALSERRAKSSYEYLVSKGVASSRMEYKGFGETQLVNECDDGVPCTEEQHAQNRRTVVEIL
ncbi:carboxypeptidase regulatory-like domain-containing protein [Gaoshiqia sp. Z1-71]|uniref:OmpA family protein n=1 Tax=Gaoshiqia hydrogeniformans TaxID=3290090 RepID=UPI003BF7E302